MLSPAEIAAKYKRNAGNAESDYVKGVESVTEAPGQKAAENVEKYVRKVQEKAETWAENVAATSLPSWKESVRKKKSNYSTGVNAGAEKIAAFQTQFQPHLKQGMDKIASMPNVTDADNEARMLEMTRHNRKFKFKK